MRIDKILIIVGASITIASIIAAAILLFVFKLKKEKIKSQLENDYGKRE